MTEILRILGIMFMSAERWHLGPALNGYVGSRE